MGLVTFVGLIEKVLYCWLLSYFSDLHFEYSHCSVRLFYQVFETLGKFLFLCHLHRSDHSWCDCGSTSQPILIVLEKRKHCNKCLGWLPSRSALKVSLCILLFLLLEAGGDEGACGVCGVCGAWRSNNKMSTSSRLGQWKPLPSSPESFVLNFISTSRAKITC